MKTLEKLETVKGLGQKVAALKVELDVAKGTKGVVAVKQELLKVATELDSIASQETGLTSLYIEATERQLKSGKQRIGVRQGLNFLGLALQVYISYLEKELKKEQILPDGVYLRLTDKEREEDFSTTDEV